MQPPVPRPHPRVGLVNQVALVLVVFHAMIVAPVMGMAISGALVQVLGPLLAFPLWLVFGIPLYMAFHFGGLVPARLPLDGAGALPETLRDMLMHSLWPVAALIFCGVASAVGLWLVYRAAWRALRSGGAVHTHLRGGGAAVCIAVTACLSLLMPALLWFAPGLMWAQRHAAFALAHLTPTPEMGALMASLFLARWTGAGTPQRWLGLAVLTIVATLSIYSGAQFRMLTKDHRHNDGGFGAALRQRWADLDQDEVHRNAGPPVPDASLEIPGLRFPVDTPASGIPELGRWHRPPAHPQR